MGKRTAKQLGYDRRYRLLRRERVMENALRWYYANKSEEGAAIQRDYSLLKRLAFPEEARTIALRSSKKNRAKKNIATRQWFKLNPEYSRQWRTANPDRLRKIAARHRKKHAGKRKQYHLAYGKKRRSGDMNYRILCGLRSAVSSAIRGNRKCRNTESLLGCSIPSFRLYLESKFETGMSWENYGRDGWHIDHIMPCAIFDLSKTEHQKRCFHFSNMQPMWAKDNIRKGHKLLSNQFQLI